MARPNEGHDGPDLVQRTITVAGVERTYWTAPERPAGGRLLLAFHGLGISGPLLSDWTGLGERGPAAGFVTVFPDAVDEMWEDHGTGRLDHVDDPGFVAALVASLAESDRIDPRRVFLTGLSNGATFVERLVRTGAVRTAGFALVAGTARTASQVTTPIAAGPTAVLIIAGTGDRMVPYAGGVAEGVMAWVARRRVRHLLADPGGHGVVGVEELAAEWATVDGCASIPVVERLPATADGFSLARLKWPVERPPGAPVVVYRIDDGGHGWPGGSMYVPGRVFGRVPAALDATQLVLDFATRSISSSA
jgi:polyhydroxybutyrate depolymerase